MRSATASGSVSSATTTRVRRPFRDNPRLILAGIGILLGALVGILVLADRGSRLAPDFLAEGVLYALSVTNIMMLLALVFVLARNIVKLLVERRRAIPFVRFRAKLVFILLGMTLIPAVLVLIVGTNVVMRAVDQWFNEPVEEILSSANQIAGDYYRERQQVVTDQAARIAGLLGTADLGSPDVRAVRAQLTREVNDRRVAIVQIYRAVRTPTGDHGRRAAGGCRRAKHAAAMAARLGGPARVASRRGCQHRAVVARGNRRRRQPGSSGQRHSQRQSRGDRGRGRQRLSIGRPG